MELHCVSNYLYVVVHLYTYCALKYSLVFKTEFHFTFHFAKVMEYVEQSLVEEEKSLVQKRWEIGIVTIIKQDSQKFMNNNTHNLNMEEHDKISFCHQTFNLRSTTTLIFIF